MIQKQGQNDFVLPFPKKKWTGLEGKKRLKREQEKEKPLIFHIMTKMLDYSSG